MTRKMYLVDDAVSGDVLVTEIITGEKPIVRLEATWFHAQGGGQKADRGHIGSSKVIHVAHNGDNVDHYVDSVEGLSAGSAVPFKIDRQWRELNAVYHTAGHLIAGVGQNEFPQIRAVQGHQWPGEARVEFVGTVDNLEELKRTINASIERCIAENCGVQVIGDPFTNRAIKIGDFEPIPCGGTHVKEIRQIGRALVTSIKKKKDKIRMSYEAFPAEWNGNASAKDSPDTNVIVAV